MKDFSYFCLAGIAAGLWLAGAGRLPALDYYVAQGGQEPAWPYTNGWTAAASNLQEAVNAAAEGDTVWIGAGIYTAPEDAVVYNGTNVVFVEKLLNLIGATGDPADVILDGEGRHRGLYLKRLGTSTTPMLVQGLTIRNGHAVDRGGGIRCEYDDFGASWPCMIRDCLIVSNTVVSTNWAYGGALYGYGFYPSWSIEISNCVLRGNVATNTLDVDRSGGGAIYLRSNARMKFLNCVFEDNWAGKAGAVWTEFGTLQAANCIFQNNRAPRYENAAWGGGAVFLSSSHLELQNSLFEGNFSSAPGGAIAMQHQGLAYRLELRSCTLVKNQPQAIYQRAWSTAQNYFSPVKLWNTICYGNQASDLSLPIGAYPVTNAFTNCCFSATNFLFFLSSVP